MKRSLIIILSIVFFATIIIISISSCRFVFRQQLFYAIENNDLHMLKRAISCGADVNKPRYPVDSWWLAEFSDNPTPLMQACKTGNIEIMQFLLECGADINKQDPWTVLTALEKVLVGNNGRRFELALFLVDHGADIHVSNSSYSLVERSLIIFEDEDSKKTIDQGFELFQYLLINGASIEPRNGNHNILTFAARRGNIQAVEYMIDMDVFSINDQDADGKTALIAAVEKGRYELAELLIKMGADPEINDNEGKSAIDYASEKKDSEMLRILQN